MDQVERARRYLERIRAMYAGVPYREDASEYYPDDVCSFFIHCYHIRDWIVALHPAGVSIADVDLIVNSSFELQVCADLCNGTKHCRLKHTRTSKRPFVAGHRFVSTGQGVVGGVVTGRPQSMQCQFEILADGEYYDALWLAERCMAVWDGYLDALGSAG